MAPETTTIRVASKTRDRLNELARRQGKSAGVLVDQLVREADDRALLEAAADGWERLERDPSALAAYRDETRGLDAYDAPLPDY